MGTALRLIWSALWLGVALTVSAQGGLAVAQEAGAVWAAPGGAAQVVASMAPEEASDAVRNVE